LDCGGQAPAAGGVVEAGHGRGPEITCEPAGRAPELGLLGRIPGIHRR